MKSNLLVRALAMCVLLVGSGTAAGSVFVQAVSPMLRATSMITGGMLCVAGVLMLANRRGAVLLLWLSAFVYCGSIVGPSFQKHGVSFFGALIPEFYLSLSIRVAVAVVAQLTVRFAAAVGIGRPCARVRRRKTARSGLSPESAIRLAALRC